MNKCIECPFHRVISDRDPDDWFNDDDVAVVCSKTGNPDQKLDSRWLADHSEFRVVSGSLRPYEVSKVIPPTWCPVKHLL